MARDRKKGNGPGNMVLRGTEQPDGKDGKEPSGLAKAGATLAQGVNDTVEYVTGAATDPAGIITRTKTYQTFDGIMDLLSNTNAIAQAPGQLIFGVGPGGFADLTLQEYEAGHGSFLSELEGLGSKPSMLKNGLAKLTAKTDAAPDGDNLGGNTHLPNPKGRKRNGPGNTGLA